MIAGHRFLSEYADDLAWDLVVLVVTERLGVFFAALFFAVVTLLFCVLRVLGRGVCCGGAGLGVCCGAGFGG